MHLCRIVLKEVLHTFSVVKLHLCRIVLKEVCLSSASQIGARQHRRCPAELTARHVYLQLVCAESAHALLTQLFNAHFLNAHALLTHLLSLKMILIDTPLHASMSIYAAHKQLLSSEGAFVSCDVL
jgi:hypothetical protein